MSTKQFTFRLEPELIDRVDEYARSREAAEPGLRMSRTDALRILLTRALDEASKPGEEAS